MSVIHEAVKKARQVWKEDQTPDRLSAVSPEPKTEKSHFSIQKTGRTAPEWVVWFLSALVLAEAGLCFWESNRRQKAEEKMKLAYLELNDARGNYLDAKKDKEEVDLKRSREIRKLQEQMERAVAERREIAMQKQSVEFDNLQKTKKISELTKNIHQLEMDKYKLQDEVDELNVRTRTLKEELDRWSSPLPIEAQRKGSAKPLSE